MVTRLKFGQEVLYADEDYAGLNIFSQMVDCHIIDMLTLTNDNADRTVLEYCQDLWMFFNLYFAQSNK